MTSRWSRFSRAISTLRHTYRVFLGHGVSFSQFGEDLLVSRIASIPTDSFYIDVGAAYPVKNSNTFRFYLRGGNGLTIEPNPDLVRQHQRIRPRDICISAGISTTEEVLAYYRFEIPDYNTFDKDTVRRLKLEGMAPRDTLYIPTVTLSSILERNVGMRTIDFMSIDCEGMDLDVVRSSNWDRFRPRILAIEDHDWSFELPKESQIEKYLYEVDYRLAARLSYTSIYVIAR
ncbi:MAG: FkbM family methyltransferase [Hyphomonas sp.]|nr:FkbM family methyltransferase [Hyphomonas sp.]